MVCLLVEVSFTPLFKFKGQWLSFGKKPVERITRVGHKRQICILSPHGSVYEVFDFSFEAIIQNCELAREGYKVLVIAECIDECVILLRKDRALAPNMLSKERPYCTHSCIPKLNTDVHLGSGDTLLIKRNVMPTYSLSMLFVPQQQWLLILVVSLHYTQTGTSCRVVAGQ